MIVKQLRLDGMNKIGVDTGKQVDMFTNEIAYIVETDMTESVSIPVETFKAQSKLKSKLI